MIADLTPYPETRPSGVARLGEVPTHWSVKRLRTVAELRVSNVDKKDHEGEQRVRLCNYVDVFKNDTIRADMPFMVASASSREIERFRLRVGDVLITKDSEDWQEIGVPAYVAEEAEDLVCGYHLALLRPWSDDLVGRYLHWQLQSDHVHWQLSVAAKGVTRYGLDHDGIKGLVVALPPRDEQADIVRFLDNVDRRIRRSIAAKQKMIRLLEEQKAAIVHQAISRGVNREASMKRSGVDWLGEVPAHWTVDRLKHSFREVDQRSTTGAEELLSVSHKTGVTARSEKNISMFRAETNVGYKICEVDDFCANTMWLWMGAIGIAKRRGVISPAYAVYRLRGEKDFLPDYVDMFIRLPPLVAEYSRRSKGITKSRLRLYPEGFLDIVVARPPLEEQARILSYIAEATIEIDRARSLAQSEIALLNEYRTRLVTDVATGKLDVRKAAVGLPTSDLDLPDEMDEEFVDDEEALSLDAEEEVA